VSQATVQTLTDAFAGKGLI